MKISDILVKLTAVEPDLARRYGVQSLHIFGSVARGDAGPDSDVDILVEFSRPVGLFDFIELQQTLQAILGSKVDLGTRRSLKPAIKEQVLREAVRVP